MSGTDYIRFISIGIVSIIVLSMTHGFWGNYYSKVVMKTTENVLPGQASLKYSNSTIWVTVQPTDIEIQRHNILAAAKNNPNDSRIASLTEDNQQGISYTQGFTTKEMSYWLVISITVLLALPMANYRKRIRYLLIVTAVGFIGNITGLYIVVNGQSSFVDNPGSLNNWNTLVQLVSFAMLIIPSFVWFPVLINTFRSDSGKT